MTYQADQTIKCDVLILGSGIAGLMLARELAACRLKTVVVSKGKLLDSNTAFAQGGIAAVTAANILDAPALHLKDTLAAGAGLVDEAAASAIIASGASLIERLIALGMEFDRKKSACPPVLQFGENTRSNEQYIEASLPTAYGSRNSQDLDVALEGGHCRARVLHSKDATGKAVASALIASLEQSANVEILENSFALDLLMIEGRCRGVCLLEDGELTNIVAQHTVLATGGLGQVFERTTNPDSATGDGIAMAYRAGARLIDMEFVQFHPTALVKAGAPAALISEAVRGAGAILLDQRGERFAFRFHKDGELATRDIVARAIYTTIIEQDAPCVYLDMRPIGSEKIIESFPNILKTCHKWGIDPLVQPVPIAPAAHYFMGGIWADLAGSTTIPGLYAIGECASTGLHGANRLASNSLLEGGVMAMRLAESILGQEPARNPARGQAGGAPAAVLRAPYALPSSLNMFRHEMFSRVGLERDEAGLKAIIANCPETCLQRVPADRATAESANIALIGYLIARSALERRESRGAHWRSDFPQTDDKQYKRRYYVSRKKNGWLEVGDKKESSELPLSAAAR